MNIFKKKPEETQEAAEPQAAESQASQVVDDRCSECKGEGLIWHDGAKRHERCSKCQGTGKQSDVPAQFAVGTTVIKPDGTYLQTEQGLIKQ